MNEKTNKPTLPAAEDLGFVDGTRPGGKICFQVLREDKVINKTNKLALLIDIQNDFIVGSLPVPGAKEAMEIRKPTNFSRGMNDGNSYKQIQIVGS